MVRRLAVVLAVVSLLALAQASMAMDLQAGWYAQIRGVSIYAYDSNNRPYLFGGGWFYGSLGTYGPFTVTADPGGNPQYARTVSVLSDAYCVGSGTSVEMPIGAMPQRVAYVHVWWETNYDASKMRLEFWRRDPATGAVTRLWTQSASGYATNGTDMAYNVDPNGLSFRVMVLPEPSSLLCLTAGLSAVVTKLRRRAR